MPIPFSTTFGTLPKLFVPSQEEQKMLKNFLELPILDELKPGEKRVIGMIDLNKDWLLKQKLFFAKGNESRTFFKIPVKSTDSPSYQESQGWKEQIDNTPSGEPIKILLRTVWHNEIDKEFDQIVEFQLICTKIDTGRSYTFLPTGNVIGGQ